MIGTRIRKLLIANRGEIACRIIRTARRLGIETVAVYSDADKGAMHVRMADEAARLAPPPPAVSYMLGDAVIEAARAAGADAVHPGYGFLSENAGFAASCTSAGLIFVGPSAEAIRAMGDKANAKALMRQAGVPVVSGYDEDDQSPARLAREAEQIGYPLLVKAAAGGGGRGMRQVSAPEELWASVQSARREADSAFGDGRLLLEKLVEDARHIEVQVFGDTHGTIIHLGERDCSTQRRHQKIIEEAPSPFVNSDLRRALGDAAIAAARAVGYVGAGTVEFIVGTDRRFHFLEMNTRLQVEHPVTEMISGLDLVEWQLRVASGERLPLRQDEIRFSGHAIEARLCAENPTKGFAPETGTILHWRPERAATEDVRIDHGVTEGDAVTPHYDPMLAKIIVRGETREQAIDKIVIALRSLPLLGVVTNRGHLLRILGSNAFRHGEMTTALVDRCKQVAASPASTDVALAAALIVGAGRGDWFTTGGVRRCPVTLATGEKTISCAVLFERAQLAGVEVEGTLHPLDADMLDGAVAARSGNVIWLECDGDVHRFEEFDPLARSPAEGDDRLVLAPVSGLLRIFVDNGQRVVKGEIVAIIEAMKMETRLSAGKDGIVTGVSVRDGDQVAAGDILLMIDDGEQEQTSAKH